MVSHAKENAQKETVFEGSKFDTLNEKCKERYGPSKKELGNLRRTKKDAKKNIKRNARSELKLSGAIATEVPKLENFGFRSEKVTVLRGHPNQCKGIAIRLAERDNLEVKLCI